MPCVICYQLCNLKNVKKNDGEVLLLSNIPLWVFFTLFKLYKWYQIPQSISYNQYLFLVTTTSISPKYEMSFPFVIKLIGLFPEMGLIYVISWDCILVYPEICINETLHFSLAFATYENIAQKLLVPFPFVQTICTVCLIVFWYQKFSYRIYRTPNPWYRIF